MRALRWWSLLLVPGSFVAGHELGYQAAAALGSAPAAAAGEHGYLHLLVALGVPFAGAALARTFLAGMRRQLPPVRTRTLAVAQVAAFLAVELVEHGAAGLGPVATLTQPAVVLGLVAQVVVAVALALVVRTAHEAGSTVAAARRRRATARAAPPAWRPAAHRPVVAAVPASPVTSRGPPALPFPAA